MSNKPINSILATGAHPSQGSGIAERRHVPSVSVPQMVQKVDGPTVERGINAWAEQRAAWRRESLSTGLWILDQAEDLTNQVRWPISRVLTIGRKVRDCGTRLVFRLNPRTMALNLVKGNFCHQRLVCPACTHWLGLKAQRRYLPRVLATLDSRPNSIPSMLTLTIPAGPNLRERYTILAKGLAKMTAWANRAKKGHSRTNSEFGKVLGGVGRIEIKLTHRHYWHVHFHGIVIASSSLSKRRLRKEWAELSGESLSRQCLDVRPFHHVGRSDNQGILHDAATVTRYCFKPQQLSRSESWTAFALLHGLNLARSWGSLWGIGLTKLNRIEFGEHGYTELGEPACNDGVLVSCHWNGQRFVIHRIKRPRSHIGDQPDG